MEVVENTFFYSGYEFDKETGLYYLRSRYYNAETARFTQEDSFNGFYQDPLSLNKYTYAHNNPVTYNDPDGKAIYEEAYGNEHILADILEKESEKKQQQEYDEYAAMMGNGIFGVPYSPPTYTPTKPSATADVNSTIKYSYDQRNLPTSIDYGNDYVVDYTYDKNGNVLKVQTLGQQILYTYDNEQD